MAGSWNHVTDKKGNFLGARDGGRSIGYCENMRDAYEAIEQMHLMIQILGKFDLKKIKRAEKKSYELMNAKFKDSQ